MGRFTENLRAVRTRLKGADNTLVDHACGDIPQSRILIGRDRRIRQEAITLHGLDLGLTELLVISHGGGGSLRSLSHVYNTTADGVFVPGLPLHLATTRTAGTAPSSVGKNRLHAPATGPRRA